MEPSIEPMSYEDTTDGARSILDREEWFKALIKTNESTTD